MARIRSIKPDFFTSETIAQLDMTDRLLFIGLWTHVDDNGVCRDVPALMKAAVFPLDEDVTLTRVAGGLMRLASLGLVVRYKVDGKGYLAIPSWTEHQKVQHPGKPRYPEPDQAQEILTPDSGDSHETLTPEQGAGSREQGWEQGAGARGCRSHEKPSTTLAVIETTAVAHAPARRRDHAFDALCQATGTNPAELTSSARGKLNRALAEIRGAWQGTPEELPHEILVRAARYLAQFGDARITDVALAKHWGSLTPESELLQSGNVRKQASTPSVVDRLRARGPVTA